MRIAVIPERLGNVLSPCASIRVVPFLERAAGVPGVEVRYLLKEEVASWRPDVVVWHRVSVRAMEDVAALEACTRRLRARTIYDLDDNLLDLDGHGEARDYAPLVEAVEQALGAADEVWCSTPRLEQRVRTLCKVEPRLMPNVLDPVLWGEPPPQQVPDARAPLRLLYMGTRTHDADLELLLAAVRLCEERAPGAVRLSLVGVSAQDVGGPAWLHHVAVPAHVGASYPAFVHWFRTLRGFDLGVAPLLESRFNDCKSSIKVLDYAALGLPTLASDVPAYADAMRNGIDCLLVANRAVDWADALLSAAHDRNALRELATRAVALVGPAVFEAGASVRLERLLA